MAYPSASMDSVLELLQRESIPRTTIFTDRPSGLLAFLVLDDLTLGPAAGGVRTRSYATQVAAIEDAIQLARAMTVKCALAGLDAGGGKVVVLDHPRLDRARAFARLGEFVEELGGTFRTAGDLGTTAADLAIMAQHSRFIHTDELGLAEATARGVLRAMEAAAAVHRGDGSVRGLRVAVQGAGAIGAAVARELIAAGAEVWIADVVKARAEQLAAELSAKVADAEDVIAMDVDVLAPCAVGGVITGETARQLRAWAVCGAANNILASPQAGEALYQRRILFVPDPIASAGAVIAGIGRSLMNLEDPTPLIDRLGATSREVLEDALSRGIPPAKVAAERARARIEAARAARQG